MFGFFIIIESTIIFSLPKICGRDIISYIIMFKILIF